MKPKVSPTSPKAKKDDSKDEIGKIYGNSLKTINQPEKSRNNFVGILTLIVIFGFISGVLGTVLFIGYGDKIPFLEKIDFFSGNQVSSYFINSHKSDLNFSKSELNKFMSGVDPTVVLIFKKNKPSNDLTSLYVSGDMLANAFVLTTDGFAVLNKDLSDYQADDLVAITPDKRVLAVEKKVKDKVSGYEFLKIKGGDFQSLDIADRNDISILDPIILVKRIGFSGPLKISQSNIIDVNFHEELSREEIPRSSEKYYSDILINTNLPNFFEGSLAFTNEEKIIGFVYIKESKPLIRPIREIKPVLGDLLEGDEVVRPYFGINYIDLSQEVNLPLDIASNQKQGALLFDNNIFGVDSIIAGSPAEKAGLEPGDIITSVNGVLLDSSHRLNEIILLSQPGETVNLTYLRNNIERKASVILSSLK